MRRLAMVLALTSCAAEAPRECELIPGAAIPVCAMLCVATSCRVEGPREIIESMECWPDASDAPVELCEANDFGQDCIDYVMCATDPDLECLDALVTCEESAP